MRSPHYPSKLQRVTDKLHQTSEMFCNNIKKQLLKLKAIIQALCSNLHRKPPMEHPITVEFSTLTMQTIVTTRDVMQLISSI